MNKSQLASAIADRAQLRQTTVLAVLDRLEDVVVDELRAGGQVLLTGFCKFETVDRQARTRRNPRTGEPVEVAAKRIAKIRPMATLRASVAGGG